MRATADEARPRLRRSARTEYDPPVKPATAVPVPVGHNFFEGPAVDVAAGLLGLVMTRRVDGVLRRARLVETEAYLGPRDLASHASKGRTARTDVMFGPPGRAYVYFVYGLHDMFNIVTGPAGAAQAVLVRAAEPLDEWTVDLSGPARLARAFEITRRDNRLDLTAGDIRFYSDLDYRPRVARRKRVGIDYAKHWKERLLRFVDVNSPVSRRLKR
jgi:DNA-3-methyladenine glycosylase